MNLKAHIEETTEEHLRKSWSELMKAKEDLEEIKGHVEEIQGRVGRLQSEKEAIETSLQKNSEEVSDLKLSEKKVEVENLSLRKEVTEMKRQLVKMRENAASENKSLKELVQTMQTRLNAMETKEERKREVEVHEGTRQKSTVSTPYKTLEESSKVFFFDKTPGFFWRRVIICFSDS